MVGHGKNVKMWKINKRTLRTGVQTGTSRALGQYDDAIMIGWRESTDHRYISARIINLKTDDSENCVKVGWVTKDGP